MAVEIPRRSPLHATSTSMEIPRDDTHHHYHQHHQDDVYDDENDEMHLMYHSNNNHDHRDNNSPPPAGTPAAVGRTLWSDSPTRNSSSSSSSSTSLIAVDDPHHGGSPLPYVGDVIQIPHNNGGLRVPFSPSNSNNSSYSNSNHRHQEQRRKQQQQMEHLHSPFDLKCRSSSSSLMGSSSSFCSPFLLGLLLVGLVATYLSHTSVGYAVEKATELRASRDQLSQQLYDTEHDLQLLKREINAMNGLLHPQHQQENHSSQQVSNYQRQQQQQALSELTMVRDRIQDLSNSGESLKNRVQSISRESLEAKYGPGRHYVEMELIFPTASTNKNAGNNNKNLKTTQDPGPTKFVIEMAPTSDMPHAVFTFLEMVSVGLIDGCSFILNALHVLKAAPLPYDGSLAAAKAKAFADHGLEGVAFKEYNDAYPHQKYTMGFAADGSPSFYINTEDNTDIHIGDPCFGRIVDGLDTIQRLEAAPTRNGIWFAQKIGIVRARILPNPNEYTRQGLRQQQQQSQEDADQDSTSDPSQQDQPPLRTKASGDSVRGGSNDSS